MSFKIWHEDANIWDASRVVSPKVTTKASIKVADKIGMKETFLGVARGDT